VSARDMPSAISPLQCTECKNKHSSTTKNKNAAAKGKNVAAKGKKAAPGRFEIKKYCPFDRRHTLHREVK
jgi:large subunit ribosomal protein L33